MKNLVETAKFKRISVAGRRLAKTKSGVALIEFAYSLPILMAMMMSGAELTNYATVKMRLSQVALHIADNGGRIGNGTVLSVKKISETRSEEHTSELQALMRISYAVSSLK